MKTKIPYTTALPIAEHIKNNLSPHCKKCEIVGSIRRKKPMVGDIEILCLPKMYIVADGLFDTMQVRCSGWMQFFRNWKPQMGKPADGKYLKCQYGKMQVDIFIAYPDNYGLIKWLRTGSSEYNKNVLMKFKRKGFKMEDGRLYKFNGRTFDILSTPTEAIFYEAIGLPRIDPQLRTAQCKISIS